ncbi:hypothetical protein LVB77_10015 [Lysobacter sp. 5GHs7-4]|uniref:hypothetical protein n=1 Tax=Lysobacter sp. 5GHs7-4 TaxID=2904253 RepID=UPI001E2F8D2E|nr:hypothetical protein [Lysobacter sp. 5GHs7-4]UHQ24977.1 hypothetical protein LVB77_10015 [Lysobacter sp. 5GHs7-4]
MDKTNLESEVARLDGYLSGLAALNGEIRDYTSFCYQVQVGEGASIERALQLDYHWLPDLRFSSVRRLDNGTRDLEAQLGVYLVRNSPGSSQSELDNLRRFLAFRVLDKLSDIVGDLRQSEVVELMVSGDAKRSDCVFFCVCADGFAVVLQFNDDRKFVAAAGGAPI